MERCPGCTGARQKGSKSCSECLEYQTEKEEQSGNYDTRLTLLLATTDYQHAQMVERRLEILGIACYLSSSAISGVWGDAEEAYGESRLYVPELLWKRACQAIRAEIAPS